MSHPGGSAAELQQAQPEQGADGTVSPGGTVSLGNLDPSPSGSWRSLTSRLLPLVSLYIPSFTLCHCQAPRLHLQPAIHPHSQGQEPAWVAHEFSTIHSETGAPPNQGLWLGIPSPLGRGQPGECMCSWELWPTSAEMQGSRFCSP